MQEPPVTRIPQFGTILRLWAWLVFTQKHCLGRRGDTGSSEVRVRRAQSAHADPAEWFDEGL